MVKILLSEEISYNLIIASPSNISVSVSSRILQHWLCAQNGHAHCYANASHWLLLHYYTYRFRWAYAIRCEWDFECVSQLSTVQSIDCVTALQSTMSIADCDFFLFVHIRFREYPVPTNLYYTILYYIIIIIRVLYLFRCAAIKCT